MRTPLTFSKPDSLCGVHLEYHDQYISITRRKYATILLRIGSGQAVFCVIRPCFFSPASDSRRRLSPGAINFNRSWVAMHP